MGTITVTIRTEKRGQGEVFEVDFEDASTDIRVLAEALMDAVSDTVESESYRQFMEELAIV